MFGIFQSLIQLLYLYKTSNLYNIHIFVMLLLLGIHIYFFIKQQEIVQKQENPPQTNCSQKIDYVDYQRHVRKNTSEALAKLQNNPDFARYMRLRQDPNSRYYAGKRNYDDVEEIVFSDEEDEDNQEWKGNKPRTSSKNY